MASLHKCSTPPKTIEELIELSRLFILNNYGKTLEQDVQQRFYNKIQQCFMEISVELNIEKKKAVLQKLESGHEQEEKKQEQRRKVLQKLESEEHASSDFGGGKKKRKSRRHKKKKRNKTKRRSNLDD